MSEQALSIVGSSRRNGARAENDFYPTPAYVTEALLDREAFPGTIWEPACGNGAMSRVLLDDKYDHSLVISSDLVDRGFGETRIDFLNSNRKVDHIITNPPFDLAFEFLAHAKECASGKIAFFLKTAFLEGAKRYRMFKDKEFPFARMYQFSKRVRLDKNGVPMGCKAGMIAFAWFVWDKHHSGPATIDWII